MYNATRLHPVASSKGGCISGHGLPGTSEGPGFFLGLCLERPKEPGEYDVVTVVPRPGAIDECAIASVNRLLMALSRQPDWSRHEDQRAGCVLAGWLSAFGWKAGIEILSLSPQEMNASIARAHQFNGFLGSSVVNFWHISAAH